VDAVRASAVATNNFKFHAMQRRRHGRARLNSRHRGKRIDARALGTISALSPCTSAQSIDVQGVMVTSAAKRTQRAQLGVCA